MSDCHDPWPNRLESSGHRTRATFDRYNITDGRDQREALEAVRAYREQQAAA